MGATVIYDFETSGLSPHIDDVIEIGAKCIDNQVSFQSLVIPLSKKGICSKITEITGITNELLKNNGRKTLEAFKLFFTYLKDIYDVYEDITLVAHNGLHFDDIFLRRMLRYLQGEGITDYDDMFSSIIFVDSLMVARYVHPTRRYHNMKDLCQLYNIQNNSAHRAMGDVDALCELWKYFINTLKQKHIDVCGNHLRYILYYE